MVDFRSVPPEALKEAAKDSLTLAIEEAGRRFQQEHGVPPETVQVRSYASSGHDLYVDVKARGRI